jgi:hypothetical protein
MSKRSLERDSLEGVREAGTSYVISPSFRFPMGGGGGVNSCSICLRRCRGAIEEDKSLVIGLMKGPARMIETVFKALGFLTDCHSVQRFNISSCFKFKH